MKLLSIFILSVLSIITFVIKTSHKGTLHGGVKPKEDMRMELFQPIRHECKAVICGDTINFYAASYVRCDDLYKFQHFIGKGKFLRTGEEMYFYNPNSKSRFVTVQELEQKFGRKVYFTDVYNCN
jgi:hypothetical protein